MNRAIAFVAMAISVYGLSGCSKPDNPGSVRVEIPLTGLTGDCCNLSVEKALDRVDGIERATVNGDEASRVVVLVLEDYGTIEISRLQESLQKASKALNDIRQLGLNYQVNVDSLVTTDAVSFKATLVLEDSRKRLQQELARERGYRFHQFDPLHKNQVYVSVSFESQEAPTVERAKEIIQRSGMRVDAVVLRGAKTTARVY